MYSFCAMYSFRMSFCRVPESRAHAHALLLGHRQVHGPEHGRRRVDGHGDGDIAQRNAAEQDLHVLERTDRRAALADFALAQGVVGVVAHQGGQVEGHGKAGLPLLQQVVIAAVGLLRRGEAGELAHGPELAAVHVAVDAARVGKLAGRPRFERTPSSRSVDRLDRHAADCRKLAFGGLHRVQLPYLSADWSILAPHSACAILRTKHHAQTHDFSGIRHPRRRRRGAAGRRRGALGQAFGTYLQRHAGKRRSTWAATRG